MDEMIPMSFRSWILCLLGVLGTLFVICLATPIFTAVVVPMAVVYYFVQVTQLTAMMKQTRTCTSLWRLCNMFLSYIVCKRIQIYSALSLYKPALCISEVLCCYIQATPTTGFCISISHLLTLWRNRIRNLRDKSVRARAAFPKAE